MKRFAVAAVAALALSLCAGAEKAQAGDVRFQYGFTVTPNGGYFYAQQGVARNAFGGGYSYRYQYYQGPGAPFGVYRYQVYPNYNPYFARPYVNPYPYGYRPYNPYLRRW